MKMFGIVLLVASSLAAASPEVKWEHSLDAAMTRAKAEHKVIFVDLWTGWCGWCIKLQKETFPSEEAKAALGKVVAVSLKTQEADGKPTASPAPKGPAVLRVSYIANAANPDIFRIKPGAF